MQSGRAQPRRARRLPIFKIIGIKNETWRDVDIQSERRLIGRENMPGRKFIGRTGSVQLVGTPACHTGGRGFESLPSFLFSGIRVRSSEPVEGPSCRPCECSFRFTPPCGLSTLSFARSVSFSEMLTFFSLWVQL